MRFPEKQIDATCAKEEKVKRYICLTFTPSLVSVTVGALNDETMMLLSKRASERMKDRQAVWGREDTQRSRDWSALKCVQLLSVLPLNIPRGCLSAAVYTELKTSDVLFYNLELSHSDSRCLHRNQQTQPRWICRWCFKTMFSGFVCLLGGGLHLIGNTDRMGEPVAVVPGEILQ